MEKVRGIGGVSFRARALDAITRQLTEAGNLGDFNKRVYPNGRLARFYDPAGDLVELWQPPERDASR